MNYFTLIEDIKRTSLQFAEEFYEGDVYEFLNSGNHKYPSIILTTQNVSTTDNINSISGTLFCVDRLTDDSSNRLEIQSNAFNKLQRIISALEENTINLQSNTYTPFTEKFADLCGGMFVEFSFQYVGESLCDDMEIKEIELTQNGIYDVIGYDRAIVNVRPVVNLEDITITDNGEYTCGEGFDGFGKVNVDLRGKVKVSTAPKVLRDCLDENNEWKEGLLLDTRHCTSFTQMFYSNEYITNAYCDDWETGNCTNFNQMFRVAYRLKKLNVKNWDTSKGLTFNGLFDRAGKYANPRWKLDVTGWSAESAIDVSGIFNHQISVVGENTIEDVIEKNLCVLKGLKVSIKTNLDADDRASLRAIINGLADLNGQETKVFNVTPHNSLTEEDIAIAVGKNWTIA